MEHTPHDVQLLSLGKGILKFDRFDANHLPTGLVDIGNAPTFNLTITVDKLEHLSSREGVATMDDQVIRSRKMEGDFELDELARENLRLWLMGEVGSWAVKPMTAGAIQGMIDFMGTSDVGPRYHFQGWVVNLFPKGSLGLISTDWGKMGFDFTILQDSVGHSSSSWGELTLLQES